MTEDPVIQLRRLLLKAEVDAHGLAVVARRCEKPDRQLNDMIAGRKAFGDRIARELEGKLRPDLPHGWLLFPQSVGPSGQCAQTVRDGKIADLAKRKEDARPLMREIIDLCMSMNDEGLKAAKATCAGLAQQYPLAASADPALKQTA